MTAQKLLATKPEFAPLSLARMLWKQKVWALLVWLAIVGGLGFVIYRMPSVYRSEAVVMVNAAQIPEKYVQPTVDIPPQVRLISITQHVLNSERLAVLVEKMNGGKRLSPEELRSRVERLKDGVSVTPDKNWTSDRLGLFRIAYEGTAPVQVADITNQLAGLFAEENARQRKGQSDETAAFIDAELREAKKNLDEQEARQSTYKLRYNGELPQQAGNVAAAVNQLQTALQANSEALSRANRERAAAQNALSAAQAAETALLQPPEPRPAAETTANPVATPPPPPKESEKLQAELDRLTVRYSDDYPEVRRLRSEVLRLQELERREAASAARPSAGGARPPVRRIAPNSETGQALARQREQITSLKAQLDTLGQEIDSRQADQKRIMGDLARLQGQLANVPVREREFSSLTRDYDNSRAAYQNLLNKKATADMAADMEGRQQAERFLIVGPAQVAGSPIKPKRMLLYALICAVGFAISILFAMAKEWRRGLLLGEWELPTGLPVLGRVGSIRAARSKFASSWRQTGRSRRVHSRLALVSSAVVCLLTLIAAGLYLTHVRL